MHGLQKQATHASWELQLPEDGLEDSKKAFANEELQLSNFTES
jgi:hypothetical protein